MLLSKGLKYSTRVFGRWRVQAPRWYCAGGQEEAGMKLPDALDFCQFKIPLYHLIMLAFTFTLCSFHVPKLSMLNTFPSYLHAEYAVDCQCHKGLYIHGPLATASEQLIVTAAQQLAVSHSLCLHHQDYYSDTQKCLLDKLHAQYEVRNAH